MHDIVGKNTRSKMMANIKGKNTQPELIVRKGLFSRGYRYRLNVKKITGKPDIVLSKYNALILVNGCFWHGHNCHLFKWPKSRSAFWKRKINNTKNRDSKNLEKYISAGWRVLVIWECALKGQLIIPRNLLLDEIEAWVNSTEKHKVIRGSVQTGD